MKVGHATAPLPVPDGTPLGGYADRVGPSSGVLDELEVACVTFGSAAGRLVVVVADVICANVDATAMVRERVTAALEGDVVDVWLCATHTHSGPDVGCVAGGGPTPAPWADVLATAAADAARAAVAAERDLAGTLHSGPLRDVGSRRNDDDGVAEVTVDVVSCLDDDGTLRGVLAVVPVHPTVLPASSTVVSGDLAAAIRRCLRDHRPARDAPWIVVATGPAGDISTRRTRRAQTPAECLRLGTVAAEQISELLQSAATPLWETGDQPCAAARATLDWPARQQDPAALAALRDALVAQHAQELQAGSAASARTLQTALQGVHVAEALRDRPALETIELELAAARIGALGLFTIGAEPYHALGEQLRAQRSGPTVLLGYANGHASYLPDAAAYATTDYEVLSSPLPPDAAATTVATLIDLAPTPETERSE